MAEEEKSTEQTSGSKQDGKDSTSESQTKTEKKLEFTQEELDKKMQAREARGEAAAAKKLQKTIEDLQAKIADFEGKDLGAMEKLQRKYDKLVEDHKSTDTELIGANLKLAKLTALLKAGAQPDKLDGLLKRVSGSTEPEIEADVQELVSLGWIGKAPEPDPSKPAANGSGKPPVKDGIKKFTEAQLRAMKPEEYEANRADILKAMEGGLIQK